ncbi:MAG: c-type cytochrome [Myxococcota bacterium]
MTPRAIAVLFAVAVTSASGCDAGQTAGADAASFPWSEADRGKADAFGRHLVGVAAPYDANPALAEQHDALAGNIRLRREAAWGTVAKVLEPVPLLGLAADAEAHEEIDLPEIPAVPRFETWYGLDDFKRMFQHLYEGLGPSGRSVREPFSAADIDAAFEWNAGALERSSSWPLERYIDHVNRLGECPEGNTEEQCEALLQSNVAGAAGGIPRITYSPATVAHALSEYGTSIDCLARLDTLPMDTEPDAPEDNFSTCFSQEFPVDSVLVKAQWERADFGRQLPAFDTDGESLRRVLQGDAEWNEDGDRTVDPGADQIYTIRLRNGATYRLAGLHIMTKELRHWQWTTLWWSDTPDTDFGADRPESVGAELPAVWSNYKMCSVTFFDENDEDAAARFADLPTLADAIDATTGGPSWCSNPYLEHGRGNAATNCIGCHQHGGATVDFDRDGDDLLDPLEQERIIDEEDRFPEHGRTQIRELFPADYLYSFNRVDDFAGVMASEVDFFDFQDGEAARPRTEAVLERTGSASDGATLFAGSCTGCHGADGTGSGFAPSLYDRVPLRDDRSLLRTLLQGKGNMPAWAETFDDQQLADLRAFLRARFDAAPPLIEVRGSVAEDETLAADTGTVPAGRYVVRLRHDPDDATGDADLHVRVGEAPTLREYDCRPYRWGSDETCTVTLTEPAIIFALVHGYDAQDNAFILTAAPED